MNFFNCVDFFTMLISHSIEFNVTFIINVLASAYISIMNIETIQANKDSIEMKVLTLVIEENSQNRRQLGQLTSHLGFASLGFASRVLLERSLHSLSLSPT